MPAPRHPHQHRMPVPEMVTLWRGIAWGLACTGLAMLTAWLMLR